MVYRPKEFLPTPLSADSRSLKDSEIEHLRPRTSPFPSPFILPPILTPIQSSLSYTCVCSNGQSPNASQYSQTIPYYECTEAATQCVNNCAASDSSCQSACRTAHPCGAQAPIRVNTSTISTMSATATSGGAATTADTTATGTDYSNPKSAGTQVQALALSFGRTYGFVMVLAGVTGGFMLML